MSRLIKRNPTLAALFLIALCVACSTGEIHAQARPAYNCYSLISSPAEVLSFTEKATVVRIADDWIFEDYEVQSPGSLALKFKKAGSQVTVFVENRVLPDNADYHTESFQLTAGDVHGGPQDIRKLMLNLKYLLSQKDNGSVKFVFEDAGEDSGAETADPTAEWPPPRKTGFLKLILAAAAAILSIILFMFPQQNLWVGFEPSLPQFTPFPGNFLRIAGRWIYGKLFSRYGCEIMNASFHKNILSIKAFQRTAFYDYPQILLRKLIYKARQASGERAYCWYVTEPGSQPKRSRTGVISILRISL